MQPNFLQIIFWLFIFSLPVFTQTKESRRFDVFGSFNCEDMMLRLDNLFLDLGKEPKAKAYIYVYEGKHLKHVYDREGNSTQKYFLPVFGEAVFYTRLMQNYVKFMRLPVEKAVFISGGFRENFELEFWIVPDDGVAPTPSPTLETVKYRKGKLPGENGCG